MTVAAIQNACVSGAMAGLMAGRFSGSFTATDYAALANAARAIADEFIVENTASGAALADADLGIVSTVAAVAQASLQNSGATSITAADYLAYAKQIYAASKQATSKMI